MSKPVPKRFHTIYPRGVNIVAGQRVEFEAVIDFDLLDKMVFRAFNSKGQTCRDGALTVRILNTDPKKG